jgi:hypothetical protein
MFLSHDLPLQCVTCIQFLRLLRFAHSKAPLKPIRVTRKMMVNNGPYSCNACGEQVDSVASPESFRNGLSIMWVVRDKSIGLDTFSNLIPLHWKCFCSMGPNKVNTRDKALAIWACVTAKNAAVLPRQTCMTRAQYHHITKDLQAIRTRHFVRCREACCLTASTLIDAWYRCGGCCAICGEMIRVETAKARLRLSWDRINSAQGYTAENTAPSHWQCNSAKSNRTIAECLELYRATLQNEWNSLPDITPSDDDIAADLNLERMLAVRIVKQAQDENAKKTKIQRAKVKTQRITV